MGSEVTKKLAGAIFKEFCAQSFLLVSSLQKISKEATEIYGILLVEEVVEVAFYSLDS